MAKNSMVQRELRRTRLVAKYAQKRSELKATIISGEATYDEKMAAVEKGLAAEGDALTQVYRIDISGKDQSVFGVGMKATDDEEKDIDAAFQMSIVDFEGPGKVAYFPYEILVNGKEVEALHMRFRMAVHFPDLRMTGKHGFTKLMSSPKATEKALEHMVSGE